MNENKLAYELFELEIEHIKNLEKLEKAELLPKVFRRLICKVPKLYQDAFEDLLVESNIINKSRFKELLRDAKKMNVASQQLPNSGNVKSIKVSGSTGDWTSEVLKTFSDEYYYYSGSLCSFDEGSMNPFKEETLATYLDQADKCYFYKVNANYETVQHPLKSQDGKLILGQANNIKDELRSVDRISQIPLINCINGEPRLIGKGYDKESKSIVSEDVYIEYMSVPQAKALIEDLLVDFKTASEDDKARIVASIITPALTMGGLLGEGRSPIFYVEKDKPGTGGGYLVKMIMAIYGEKPEAVSGSDNADKFMEEISSKLFDGRNLLFLDNIRGNGLSKLPKLESLTTEPYIQARIPYRAGTVSMQHRVLYVVTNGATTSPDIASRCVRLKILHQPDGYQWKDWKEGGLLEHVKSNQAKYLSAVYSLVKHWIDNGRRSGEVKGFRFNQWEKALSWIIRELYPHAHLMNTETDNFNLSDPTYQQLKKVLKDLLENSLKEVYTATSIADRAIELDELNLNSNGNPALSMGKILGKYFTEDKIYNFAENEFRVEKITKPDPHDSSRSLKEYRIFADNGTTTEVFPRDSLEQPLVNPLKSLVSLDTSKQFLEKNNNLVKNNSINKLNKSSEPSGESREHMGITRENDLHYIPDVVMFPKDYNDHKISFYPDPSDSPFEDTKEIFATVISSTYVGKTISEGLDEYKFAVSDASNCNYSVFLIKDKITILDE